MTRALSVSKKWFSLKGEIHFSDVAGQSAYHATGEFAALTPTWTVTRSGEVVARARRKPMAWSPTWEIEGELGAFRIQRKMWSWTRQYSAVGGALDGALITGSFSDLKFEVRHGSQVLAKASGEFLSLTDRHHVEVLGDHELFVVIAMLVILLDRAQDSAFLAVN